MPYVTEQYYHEDFHGEPVEHAGFEVLCERAGEIVEEITMYRLTSEAMLIMPDHIQQLVKKAVCAQIEYLDANGGSELDHGFELQSARLGKFKYSSGREKDSRSRPAVYAPRAMRILAATGLLYRGGGSHASDS